CDKLCLAALEEVLDQHLAESPQQIPIRMMMSVSLEELQQRAEKIVSAVTAAGIKARIGSGKSQVGGGSLPRTTIPSATIDLQPVSQTAQSFAGRLRAFRIPVIAYISAGKVKLDLRAVLPDQQQ